MMMLRLEYVMKIWVKTQKRLLHLLGVLSVTLGLPLQSAAQQPKVPGEKQVWQIGEFDQTSREFGRNFEFESDEFKPVFVVGQSKTVEWPAVQVGSISRVGGKHSPPYTIQFRLAPTSKENYKLKVAVLLVNPAVPDLIVEINGHRGRFYFDRKISYYPGDDRIDSPIYGGDTLEIDLPAKFFEARENKLVLTAVEDADNPDTPASLIYDALKLTQCPSERVQPSVVVTPSVFFRQKENQTYEVTRVTVTVAEKL